MNQPALSFSLVNLNPAAGGKSILFKPGKDDLNQLQLTISNTGPDITLKGGNPVSEAQLPDKQTGLYLMFGNLLTNGGKGLTLKVKDWNFSFIAAPSAWALSPNKDMVLAQGDELVVDVTGFVVNPDAATGNLSVDYLNFQGVRDNSNQLHVTVSAPSVIGNKDLHDTIALEWEDGYNDVFLTTDPVCPFVNTNTFTLRNLSQEPVIGGPNTVFTINFVYGAAPGFGALCTAKQAQGMELSVSAAGRGGESWGVTPTAAFAWTFSPHRQVLGIGQGASRTFTIDKLISALQPGYASLYLSWQDVPGFNDGSTSLLMEKKLAPEITSFTVTPNKVQVKDGVEQVKVLASWKVTNAPNRVRVNEVFVNNTKDGEGKQEVEVSKSVNVLTLSATFGKDYFVDKEISVEVDYVPIVAKVFTVAPAFMSFNTDDSIAVTVTWDIAEADSVSFPDNLITGLQPPTGSKVVNIEAAQLKEETDLYLLSGMPIQLKAKDLNGQEFSQTIFLYQGILPMKTTTIDNEIRSLQVFIKKAPFSGNVATIILNYWNEIKAYAEAIHKLKIKIFKAIFPAFHTVFHDKGASDPQRKHLDEIYQVIIDNVKKITDQDKGQAVKLLSHLSGMLHQFTQTLERVSSPFLFSGVVGVGAFSGVEALSGEQVVFLRNKAGIASDYLETCFFYDEDQSDLHSHLLDLSGRLGLLIESHERDLRLYTESTIGDIMFVLRKQFPDKVFNPDHI